MIVPLESFMGETVKDTSMRVPSFRMRTVVTTTPPQHSPPGFGACWFLYQVTFSVSAKRYLYAFHYAGTAMKKTEDEIAQVRKVFKSCDLNSDGFIDKDEFRVLLDKLDGDVSVAEALLDFEVADTEGDGYIGFKEFIAWWSR